MSGHHANLIKAGKKILHGIWGGAYLAATVFLWWFYNSWELGLCLLFLRKWSFDLPLNKIRKLGWWYVSPELKNVKNFWDAIRKGKTNDWLHYKLFGRRVWVYTIFYIAATIILTAAILDNG